MLVLQWLDDLQRSWAPRSEPWLRVKDADTPANGRGAPRTCLYTRDDAIPDQKTSVLILFGPYTASTQFFQEIPAEGLLECFIGRILGPSSPFWTSLSLARCVGAIRL